jgi:hypothetical protein
MTVSWIVRDRPGDEQTAFRRSSRPVPSPRELRQVQRNTADGLHYTPGGGIRSSPTPSGPRAVSQAPTRTRVHQHPVPYRSGNSPPLVMPNWARGGCRLVCCPKGRVWTAAAAPRAPANRIWPGVKRLQPIRRQLVEIASEALRRDGRGGAGSVTSSIPVRVGVGPVSDAAMPPDAEAASRLVDGHLRKRATAPRSTARAGRGWPHVCGLAGGGPYARHLDRAAGTSGWLTRTRRGSSQGRLMRSPTSNRLSLPQDPPISRHPLSIGDTNNNSGHRTCR